MTAGGEETAPAAVGPTESVWDYPRPPRLERTESRLAVVHAGIAIAETARGFRVLETSHPPTYYFPPEDVRRELLAPTARRTLCEWKGAARYWSLVLETQRIEDIAWSYPDPTPAFAAIRDHFAFYPGRVDACFVDGERVARQAGDFYGGWITAKITGPFKGGPGTLGW